MTMCIMSLLPLAIFTEEKRLPKLSRADGSGWAAGLTRGRGGSRVEAGCRVVALVNFVRIRGLTLLSIDPTFAPLGAPRFSFLAPATLIAHLGHEKYNNSPVCLFYMMSYYICKGKQ